MCQFFHFRPRDDNDNASDGPSSSTYSLTCALCVCADYCRVDKGTHPDVFSCHMYKETLKVLPLFSVRSTSIGNSIADETYTPVVYLLPCAGRVTTSSRARGGQFPYFFAHAIARREVRWPKTILTRLAAYSDDCHALNPVRGLLRQLLICILCLLGMGCPLRTYGTRRSSEGQHGISHNLSISHSLYPQLRFIIVTLTLHSCANSSRGSRALTNGAMHMDEFKR